MQEEWKNINGYEGRYLISNMGKVASFLRGDVKLIKTGFTKYGYEKVTLHNETKRKTFLIHRLVALQFIPLIEDKNYVNHKDGNKKNNTLSNLEWVTVSENNIHALESGLKVMPKWDKARREKYTSYVKNSGPMNKVAVINSVTKKTFSSIKEAAKENGINYQTLFSWLTRAKHKNRTNLIIADVCSNQNSNAVDPNF